LKIPIKIKPILILTFIYNLSLTLYSKKTIAYSFCQEFVDKNMHPPKNFRFKPDSGYYSVGMPPLSPRKIGISSRNIRDSTRGDLYRLLCLWRHFFLDPMKYSISQGRQIIFEEIIVVI